MDYGSYRDSRMGRMPSSMGMPVTTITTGIPLSKRFAILEQTKAAYASEGYGVHQRQSPAVHRGHAGGAASIMDRRLALALARKSRTALASPAAQRFRVPVQARLGLNRGRGGGRGGAQVGRGGFRQIQKGAGSIARRGSPMRTRGAGNVKVLAVRGRGAGVAMRASGRGRGSGAAVGGRGGGGARGRGGARGAGRGAARGKGTTPVNKDDLDSELDTYMAKTRGHLDKQLDEYMAQAKASQDAIAGVGGTISAPDTNDVTMTE